MTDRYNSRVQKFNSDGNFLLEIGGIAAAGVAVDNQGNLYVSDPEERFVRKFNSAGAFLDQIEPTCSDGIGDCVDLDGNGPRHCLQATGVASGSAE